MSFFPETSIGDVYGSLYEPQIFGSGGAGATNSSAKGWFLLPYKLHDGK